MYIHALGQSALSSLSKLGTACAHSQFPGCSFEMLLLSSLFIAKAYRALLDCPLCRSFCLSLWDVMESTGRAAIRKHASCAHVSLNQPCHHRLLRRGEQHVPPLRSGAYLDHEATAACAESITSTLCVLLQLFGCTRVSL